MGDGDDNNACTHRKGNRVKRVEANETEFLWSGALQRCGVRKGLGLLGGGGKTKGLSRYNYSTM